MISIHASLGILFSVGGLLVCQENPKKLRHPDIGRELQMEIQVDLDFGMNPPKTTEGKFKRAQKFLEEASKDSKEPDYRYVLYRKAMRYFAEAGSIEMALKAKKGIETYDVNEMELNKELWNKFRKGPENKQKQLAFTLSVECLKVVDEKIARGGLDSAQEALKESKVYARNVNDNLLRAEIDEKDNDLDFQIKEAKSYQKALQELKSNPERPSANFIAGRFLCLLKGKWAEGLPMLKKGSEKFYAGLAEIELEPAADLDRRIELAGIWAKTAQAASGGWKVPLLERARFWCDLVWQEAKGERKTKAEDLLKSIEGEIEKIRVGAWTYYFQFKDTVSITSAGWDCGNKVRIAVEGKELVNGGG